MGITYTEVALLQAINCEGIRQRLNDRNRSRTVMHIHSGYEIIKFISRFCLVLHPCDTAVPRYLVMCCDISKSPEACDSTSSIQRTFADSGVTEIGLKRFCRRLKRI